MLAFGEIPYNAIGIDSMLAKARFWIAEGLGGI